MPEEFGFDKLRLADSRHTKYSLMAANIARAMIVDECFVLLYVSVLTRVYINDQYCI